MTDPTVTGRSDGPGPVSVRDKAHLWDVGIHAVSGTYVACCEEGETDCPCICHTEHPGQEASA